MDKAYRIFMPDRHRFIPRTPSAALRGVIKGFLSPAVLVHLGTSVKPVTLEPVSIEEILRVLAKKDLDFPMVRLLMRVFRTLSRSRDAEVALFGSESINMLERRYSRRIEKLKKLWEKKKNRKIGSFLSRLYYELALLHDESPALKRFYLTEASVYQKAIRAGLRSSPADFILSIRTLILLGRADEALLMLEQPSVIDEEAAALLTAEIEYVRKNYTKVNEIMQKIASIANPESVAGSEILSHWLSGVDK